MFAREFSAPEFRYNSVISNWDKKSAVRVKPRRCLTQGDAKLPFSAKLTPVVSPPASHPGLRTKSFPLFKRCVQWSAGARLRSFPVSARDRVCVIPAGQGC
jgi:hypothetical protein